MSYNNRQPPDSLHSAAGGRYRNPSGGNGREWERNTYRDRLGGVGNASRHQYGGGVEGGSVVRDRGRSHSVERSYRSPTPLSGNDSRGGGSYGRPLQSRWQQHEGRYRGPEFDRDRDRMPRDREREHAGDVSRYNNDRRMGTGHESMPPNLTMRHSAGPRGYEPPPMQPSSRGYGRGGHDNRGRYGSLSFGWKSTEHAESLEEGELELDDRRQAAAASLAPYHGGNSTSHFSRSFTSPNDTSAHQRRPSAFGSGFNSPYRSERRSPLPPQSQQHAYSTQYKQHSRRGSFSGRPGSRPSSRNATPSPRHKQTYCSESPRTLSPERPQSRRESRQGTPTSAAAGLCQSSGDRVDVDTNEENDVEVSVKSEANGTELQGRDVEPDGEQADQKHADTKEPEECLQNRISDIDREIAACHERLVMISGNAAASTSESKPLVTKQVPKTSNDRVVPTSPPLKSTQDSKNATATETDNSTSQIAPKSSSSSSSSSSNNNNNNNNNNKSSSVPSALVSDTSKQSIDGDVADTDMLALVVPQDSPGKAQPIPTSAFAYFNDSESENDQDGFGEKPKDNMNDVIGRIYTENQQKAAEMQATLAAPFLTAYPTFVPGSYPNPSDWPFWEENIRIHEKVKPYLVKIVAKEKKQNASHARKLQEEYGQLYAKWRKRVDKLDRQRESRQRGSASGPANASSGSQGNTGGLGSFASMHSRRRHSNMPGNPAVDEFGFSTGPLFSASANPPPLAEGAVRQDDGLFTSDAVHSEAELQAIIERLQYDDARNPDFRSQRTAAVIPNMVLDPKERAMLRFNNNSHYVEDPISFYHVDMPEPGTSNHRRIAYSNNADADHYWTQSEVSAFVAAYLSHPKQFGKIASYIPHKSMNDCVLFYYRNKKSLRLKALEAKSNKRTRRSRQSGSVGGGGSGGRKRKEKARERRERRAREEREKLAMEAAAGCAPDEYTIDTICSTPVDEGASTNMRTSALPSDDESSGVGNSSSSYAMSAETADILERRSKGSALLRSIISANRQRKSSAATEGGLLDSVSESLVFTPISEEADEERQEGDDGDTITASSHSKHRRGRDANLPSTDRQGSVPMESPEKHKHRRSEQAASIADGALRSPPGVPVSASSSQFKQSDRQSADHDSFGALGKQPPHGPQHRTARGEGTRAIDDEEGEVEDGEEPDALAARKRRQHEKGTKDEGDGSDENDEEGDDDEEEGELVEDEHWEPRRKSRQQPVFNAYALGGSIVRTRRSREADGDMLSAESGTSDDEQTAASHHKKRRSHSLAISAIDEDEEIVEASGVVVDRGNMATVADAKAGAAGPKLVSRKSSSRFGATLTAIIDPLDTEASKNDLASDLAGDISNDDVLQIRRRHSRQKSATPISPTRAGDRNASKDQPSSPPKESALDRYVAEEPSILKRPISSYETLMMCTPSGTNSLALGNAGSTSAGESDAPTPLMRRTTIATANIAGISQVSTSSPSALHAQLEAQVESEAGNQETILVGAASWHREDRRRVLRAFHKLGADFAQVASLMPTKSMAQCRYFYYHYRTPDGRMVSEIIPATLSSAAATAAAALSATPATRSAGAQAAIDGLTLPQASKPSTTKLVLPHSVKPKPTSRTVSGKVAAGSTQSIARATFSSQPVLPGSKPFRATDGADEKSAKRQRTKSPASNGSGSSDNDDDEMPLAAQLAEALAAQAAAESSQPAAPSEPTAGSKLQASGLVQRRASEIAQVRPDQINPQMQSVSALVLPSRPIAKGNSTANTPVSAGTAILPMPASTSGGSVVQGNQNRTPSPLSAPLQPPGTMTAKKSGYSSYWSVHERSAFMHYVVRLGQDWQALAEAIGSKTGTQVRNYFRANREKLNLDDVVAEYNRNKAAGTLPPLVPFTPAPSTAGGQASAPGSAAAAAVATATATAKDGQQPKKDKRGRKRKNESRASPATQEQPTQQITQSDIQQVDASISQVQQPLSSPSIPMADLPNTAPANMTSFPTMGIDGGRAVVYTHQQAPGAASPTAQFSPAVSGAPVPSAAMHSHHMYAMSPTSQNQRHPSQVWPQSQQPQPQQQLQPQAHMQSRPAPPDVHARGPPMPAPYYGQGYSQQQPHPHFTLPPLSIRTGAARESSTDPSERISGVAGRGESDTPSSQPTPPPVEGLPRFSSSPAPIPPSYQQQQQQQQQGSGRPLVSPAPRISSLVNSISPAPAPHSALHISNLTSSTPATGGYPSGVYRSTQHYPPPQPALSAQPAQYSGSSSSGSRRVEEPRKMSVTKINALLNDDAPATPRTASANWFGGSSTKASPASNSQRQVAAVESAQETGKGSDAKKPSDDEATGMAALALASMMEADRSPQQKPALPEQRRQVPLPIAQPQPQTHAERSHMTNWPSDPLPSISASPAHVPAMSRVSAFSPVARHVSPPTSSMVISPPPAAMRPQSRPSSVGPPTYHQRQYPAIPRSNALSPPRASMSQIGSASVHHHHHHHHLSSGPPMVITTTAPSTSPYANRASVGYAVAAPAPAPAPAPHHSPLPPNTSMPPPPLPPHVSQIPARQQHMYHQGSSPPRLPPHPSVSGYPVSEGVYPPPYSVGQHPPAAVSGQPAYYPPPPPPAPNVPFSHQQQQPQHQPVYPPQPHGYNGRMPPSGPSQSH